MKDNERNNPPTPPKKVFLWKPTYNRLDFHRWPLVLYFTLDLLRMSGNGLYGYPMIGNASLHLKELTFFKKYVKEHKKKLPQKLFFCKKNNTFAHIGCIYCKIEK